MKKLYVIGIGYKALDKTTREIILNADVILASERLFEVFKGYDVFEAVRDKMKVINNVNETINFIRSQITDNRIKGEKQDKNIPSKNSLPTGVVLLASGDPMFFGIGRRAIKEFGKDAVEIIPDLSCIQLAFARIKESWDDAFLMSLHGGPDPEKRRRLPYEIGDIPFLLQKYSKIAILTDKENNPSEISRVLYSKNLNLNRGIIVNVCERLGYPDERIISGRPEEIYQMEFREPNVVIVQRAEETEQKVNIQFGLREDEIAHSRGLITKDEVRAITIHKLRLPKSCVFWDIGSGSGSISIEIARLFPQIKVFAIEKDEEQIKHITKNSSYYDANIKIIKGIAPDILKDLPNPERVFIGGSGGMLSEILDLVSQKMASGIIVINATQMNTVSVSLNKLKDMGFDINASQVFISRLKPIGDDQFLNPLNPVFIIKGERG